MVNAKKRIMKSITCLVSLRIPSKIIDSKNISKTNIFFKGWKIFCKILNIYFFFCTESEITGNKKKLLMILRLQYTNVKIK